MRFIAQFFILLIVLGVILLFEKYKLSYVFMFCIAYLFYPLDKMIDSYFERKYKNRNSLI